MARFTIRSPHRAHAYRQQRVGGGLIRRVCDCGEVRVDRNGWPTFRWALRGERPGLFSPLRPTIFGTAVAASKERPAFAEATR